MGDVPPRVKLNAFLVCFVAFFKKPYAMQAAPSKAVLCVPKMRGVFEKSGVLYKKCGDVLLF